MTPEIQRVIVFPKPFLQVISVFLIAALLIPSLALGNQEEPIGVLWDRIGSYRTDAQYDRAIELINQIIQEYTNSDEILRRAHNELVNTIQQKEQDWNALEVREKARQALTQFPDLDADETFFHPDQNLLYDQLRREMFGLLKIDKPTECRVFLNDEMVGETPLQIDLIKVGTHKLTLTKSGHHDKSTTIQIGPNEQKILEMSLDRERNKRWWLYRVGPAALAGTALAIILTRPGDEAPAVVPDEPLPEPPPPPAR